jgi:hypothetical protein
MDPHRAALLQRVPGQEERWPRSPAWSFQPAKLMRRHRCCGPGRTRRCGCGRRQPHRRRRLAPSASRIPEGSVPVAGLVLRMGGDRARPPQLATCNPRFHPGTASATATTPSRFPTSTCADAAAATGKPTPRPSPDYQLQHLTGTGKALCCDAGRAPFVRPSRRNRGGRTVESALRAGRAAISVFGCGSAGHLPRANGTSGQFRSDHCMGGYVLIGVLVRCCIHPVGGRRRREHEIRSRLQSHGRALRIRLWCQVSTRDGAAAARGRP